MADVVVKSSSTNTGTVTPATPGSITATAGNLLILVVIVNGTSPTLTTPASWTVIQSNAGASNSNAMYMLANNPGGATNPSVTLGGTVVSWIAEILEFTQTGANCALQGSIKQTNAGLAQLPNILSGQSGQTIPNLLFVYSVMRLASTITPQNSGTAGLNSGETWTSGLSASTAQVAIDTYAASNLAKGPGSWPVCQGLLGSATNSFPIVAWFNTTATQPSIGDNVGGQSGLYVPNQFQGMIGG